MAEFTRSLSLPVPVADLAAWHFRAGALERLVPPWSGVEVEKSLAWMEEGAEAILRVPVGPLRIRWVARHEGIRAGAEFTDRMVRGPFARWVHRHRFLAEGAGSRLEDSIDYAVPFGPLGALGGVVVRSMLERTFAWRHRRTLNDLRRHAEDGGPKLVVAVSGASGLVGRRLCAFLTTGGHRVRRLVRGASADPDAIRWDPKAGSLDAEALEGVDAVVHLAGESIASRWSEAKRRRILESRVRGTDLLARTLATLRRPPRSFVSASAVGFYGPRGDEPIDEESPSGSGFLAEVCRMWEGATRPAVDAGIRTVHLRIGMVLAADGGALKALLTPFSLGLGGPVGSGRQGMSWIALDDLLAAMLFVIRRPEVSGPVNATAPEPVDNRTFGRTLGRVLRRPALAPLPAPVVKALFGAMGSELLLAGAFVRPARLESAGFRFDFPTLETALRFELGREATR
jgi:uncharacterized protein (TIGR01777 family)